MARIYALKIKFGKMTIDDVPERRRAEVASLLEEE